MRATPRLLPPSRAEEELPAFPPHPVCASLGARGPRCRPGRSYWIHAARVPGAPTAAPRAPRTQRLPSLEGVRGRTRAPRPPLAEGGPAALPPQYSRGSIAAETWAQLAFMYPLFATSARTRTRAPLFTVEIFFSLALLLSGISQTERRTEISCSR